jgi:hypothetical protein
MYVVGDRCREVGTFVHNALCKRHNNKTSSLDTMDITDALNETTATIDNSFPRTLTDSELRECVNEVRERTSPDYVGMRVCAICGRLQVARDLTYRTAKEVLQSKHLLQCSNHYDRIPSRYFTYDGAHHELSGLVIDRSGFLSDEEVSEDAVAPVTAVWRRSEFQILR